MAVVSRLLPRPPGRKRLVLALPQFFRVRQNFPDDRLDDVSGRVHAELARLSLAGRIGAGQTVALTASSRGIAQLPVILRAAVDHLRLLGAAPFAVPAMGSHGGATAEGQLALLAAAGVTETSIGCPIRSSMDTKVLFESEDGFPVHFDRQALEADHVLLCGRVKLHTELDGDFQSGLAKMLLIGLGKHEGAKIYHRAIRDFGFDHIVRTVVPRVFAAAHVVGGLAIVENACGHTASIDALAPQEILDREPKLLMAAQGSMAGLPFDEVDLLIVDEIGKQISGTGMDTNVIGRKGEPLVAQRPRVKRIFVRSLTAASLGNAAGIGLAEFTTERLIDQIDRRALAINCITSGHVEVGRLPLAMRTDREAIEAALSTVGLVAPQDARILWIESTAALGEVECSSAYLPQLVHGGHERLEAIAGLEDLPLDTDGNLPAEGVRAARRRATA